MHTNSLDRLRVPCSERSEESFILVLLNWDDDGKSFRKLKTITVDEGMGYSYFLVAIIYFIFFKKARPYKGFFYGMEWKIRNPLSVPRIRLKRRIEERRRLGKDGFLFRTANS